MDAMGRCPPNPRSELEQSVVDGSFRISADGECEAAPGTGNMAPLRCLTITRSALESRVCKMGPCCWAGVFSWGIGCKSKGISSEWESAGILVDDLAWPYSMAMLCVVAVVALVAIATGHITSHNIPLDHSFVLEQNCPGSVREIYPTTHQTDDKRSNPRLDNCL